MLDSLFRPGLPDTILVRERTLAFHMPRGGVPEWRREFEAIPRDLPSALEAASVAVRSARVLALPRPARFLTDADLNEIFARDPGAGWLEFHRRFPSPLAALRCF